MTEFIVYAWKDRANKIYFASKCRADSDAPYKDKKNILAPSDSQRIVVLKEFDDEMESLDYLDRLTYELGFVADGSGQLQNSMISPYHLRTGKGAAHPVTVYLKAGEQFIGDFESVVDACKSLRINPTSAYACLSDKLYAGFGKYRFLPQGEPYRPIPKRPRKRRPLGNVHPNAKKCWAYTKAGEFVGEFLSYGEVSEKLDLNRDSVKRMINGDLYSSGNYCIRAVGEIWNPPKHKTRPVKEVYGYDPEGKLHTFERLVDASLKLNGKKNSRSNILKSIRSPIDRKVSLFGWVFFCGSEVVPDYKSITLTSQGRTK